MSKNLRNHRRRTYPIAFTTGDSGAIHGAKPAHLGIVRQPARCRTAAELPLSAAQQEVIALLAAEPVSPIKLGKQLDRSPDGVTASLYALADRGLAVRVPYKGWRAA